MTAEPTVEHGPRLVAEASSNHGSHLARALELVDEAAKVGFDAVKFQLFRVAELFAPEVLQASPEHRAREQWELPAAFIPELAATARRAERPCIL